MLDQMYAIEMLSNERDPRGAGRKNPLRIRAR
jgi:hypothetical protein